MTIYRRRERRNNVQGNRGGHTELLVNENKIAGTKNITNGEGYHDTLLRLKESSRERRHETSVSGRDSADSRQENVQRTGLKQKGWGNKQGTVTVVVVEIIQ